VKLAQQRRAQLDELHLIAVARQFLVRHLPRQFEPDRPTRRRVEPHLHRPAEQVAGRIDQAEVAVAVEDGLGPVVALWKTCQAAKGEDGGCLIEHHLAAGPEPPGIGPQHGRDVHASPADGRARLRPGALAEHDQHPAVGGAGQQPVRHAHLEAQTGAPRRCRFTAAREQRRRHQDEQVQRTTHRWVPPPRFFS
jgi:hypothetical protein